MEPPFEHLPGVISAVSGYTGGDEVDPTYEQVSAGGTGHAESVQIVYDPQKIGYEKLLDVFWDIHDPTTLDRQGPDIGTQYRSVIFYSDPEQGKAAKSSKEKLEKSDKFKGQIVTEIVPAEKFYKAEEYHQRYYEKQGIEPACRIPGLRGKR